MPPLGEFNPDHDHPAQDAHDHAHGEAEHAREPSELEVSAASRRRFLRLMGASFGLAGASGCLRWPEQPLAPYARGPENRTPGVPVTYTTAIECGGTAQGLVVTSYDGRPIKVEGNSNHPLNRGAADAQAQASVLSLYDPDRSRGVVRREAGARIVETWEKFEQWLRGRLKDDGAGVAVLSEATSSPSFARLQAEVQKAYPKTQWFQYEPISQDNVREGCRLAFGAPMRPVLDLTKADVIVALDADILGAGDPLAIKYARDFAAGRRLHDEGGAKGASALGAGDLRSEDVARSGDRPQHAAKMNRLYVAEPIYTVTGGCADHRRGVQASAIAALAAQLAAGVGVAGAAAVDSGVDKAFVDAIVADLKEKGSRAVVVAGNRQPPEVHAIVATINHKLGSAGQAVVYYPDPQPKRPSHVDDLRTLAATLAADSVQTLLILGGNPVYDAPADLRFGELLQQSSVQCAHLSGYEDETSHRSAWHLSRSHAFESWGDARALDGQVSVVQPLVEPLFDGRSAIELLAMLLPEKLLAGKPPAEKAALRDPEQIVRHTVRGLLQKPVDDATWEWTWRKALFDGVVGNTALPAPAAPAAPKAVAAASAPKQPGKGRCEVVFYADTKVYDGRFANNGWLQEWPDPLTRLTWDNAALMSPETAASLGVKADDVVSLTFEKQSVSVAVLLAPGMPSGTIGLALGYGREHAGYVGDNIGKNAYSLRTTAGMGWAEVAVQPTGAKYKLATVQDHHIIDKLGKATVQERIPVLLPEGTLAAYQHDPAVGIHQPMQLSPFNEQSFDGQTSRDGGESTVPPQAKHKWGMAIDLTACVGCGACVVACQAENNIPIVGKEQVLHGREMHWLRVDRYIRDPEHAAQAVHQPLTCMHCENAPCEQVCPVAATTHSQEGINMMTYNRCVGTRYCANNCPYKVRRFNFFDYNRGTLTNHYLPNLARDAISQLQQMQKNPEVTVRVRGVMEKCTYCVQRIEKARIAARREGDRAIGDGEIQTACQQCCPAGAIVFGDLNDENSRVSKLHRLARTYGLLNLELNTQPRTAYVARVRNAREGVDPKPEAGEKKHPT